MAVLQLLLFSGLNKTADSGSGMASFLQATESIKKIKKYFFISASII
jgi:hypothetical protein